MAESTQNLVDWRTLSGAGDRSPPNLELLSRSEGDLSRNSYRRSRYPRLAARAVLNDDGTPITEMTDERLAAIYAEVAGIRGVLDRIAAPVPVLPAPEAVFKTQPRPIPGTDTAAYAAGDAMGTRFFVEVPTTEGIIANVVFLDRDDEGVSMDLALFEAEFLETANNAAFAVTDGDLLNCLGFVSVTRYSNFSVNQVGVGEPALTYRAPEKKLWGQWVTRGAPTLAAGSEPWFYLVILL